LNQAASSNPGVALHLRALAERLAVCRLDPASEVPAWATRAGFFSVTRTPDELSVVCHETSVPPGVRSEVGWRALCVEGPLDFSMVGVLASLTAPLAEAEISIFAISTHDTDYVLVKEESLEAAVAALREFGHGVQEDEPGITVGPAEDERFLWEMLYETVHWGPEEPGPKRSPEELLADPRLRRYVAGWGRPDDFAVVARDAGNDRKVGAAWYRVFPAEEPGYGFVDAATPEIAIAVVPNRRGTGVGGALLRALMEAARTNGFDAISLSVQKSNHAAVRLYEKNGFVGHRDDGEHRVMRADLSKAKITDGAPANGAQQTEGT
jgi:ribosomal protein S18 acetylase RimI-like enzyme